MTTVLLIRHAQSRNNALPEKLRTNDPGITALGTQQSKRLAAWLEQFSLTDLYCSGFLRSLETTAFIAERLGLAAHVRFDLFEQGGCYNGYPPYPLTAAAGLGSHEIAVRFPKWQIDPRIHELGWWFGSDYESDAQARTRAKSVANWIANDQLHINGVVGMVIHADFKRLLLGEMLGAVDVVERWRDCYNTGVTQITRTGTHWRLDFWNSIGHLPANLHT